MNFYDYCPDCLQESEHCYCDELKELKAQENTRLATISDDEQRVAYIEYLVEEK